MPELGKALREEQLVYVTTYDRTGKAGTVPVWFLYQDGKAYISTMPQSLKARKLALDPRVRLALGGRPA